MWADWLPCSVLVGDLRTWCVTDVRLSGLVLPAGTKQLLLDGHRRWMIASADKPGTDDWLGLDGV